MPTGEFWNTVDNPDKPWGPFDSDAKIVFPVEITGWLADLGASYASHLVIAEDPLQCLSSVHSAGVIRVKMALAPGAAFKQNKKYPFTVRIVCTDGQTDDRSLWLKVRSR